MFYVKTVKITYVSETKGVSLKESEWYSDIRDYGNPDRRVKISSNS